MAQKRPAHRPSDFTDALADQICSEIAKGRSLVKVCEKLDVGYSTVMQWLKAHDSFAEKYAQAREAQADYLADELLEIADEKGTDANDKRVRVDARKWIASKLKPKKYGDRVALAGDDESPLRVAPDAKLESRIVELLGKAGAGAVAGGTSSQSE